VKDEAARKQIDEQASSFFPLAGRVRAHLLFPSLFDTGQEFLGLKCWELELLTAESVPTCFRVECATVEKSHQLLWNGRPENEVEFHMKKTTHKRHEKMLKDFWWTYRRQKFGGHKKWQHVGTVEATRSFWCLFSKGAKLD
jgi:hypothetical protein